MPGFKVSVPHNLKPEDATERLRSVVRDLQSKFAGKIDLHWCAVEIQAVYFSGPAFGKEFPVMQLIRLHLTCRGRFTYGGRITEIAGLKGYFLSCR